MFIDHCFFESGAPFCIRVTDDIHLNLEALPGFLKWLSMAGDPYAKSIVVGNCVERQGRKRWYLQGGSGYALSHYAASKFLELGEKWVIDIGSAEDFYFAQTLAREMGMSGPQCTSPFFNGHFRPENEWRAWNWSDPKILPACPKFTKPSPVCGSYIVPYHNVVFHHSMRYFMNHFEWDKWMKSAPRDAMLYTGDSSNDASFCRARPGTAITWDYL
jgi:hypothetical protein